MNDKNFTAYLTESKKIEIRESKMPKAADDECVLKMETVTICGSDASFFLDPSYGGTIADVKLPIVLGHECSGVVVETGASVKHLSVGDRVTVEPGVGCGVCNYCLSGRYNLCREMNFMAAYPFEKAALSKYIAHSAKALFKLPDNVSFVEGALVEPLSVGLHAVERANPSFGDSAIVVGCGCIGLMTIIALRANGVKDITAIDLSDARLAFAKKKGATHTINSSKVNLASYVADNDLFADLVFETAGNKDVMASTVDIVKPGGKIITVGNIHGDTPFRFLKTNDNEVDIISVFRYVNTYPAAIKSLAERDFVISDFVTHNFNFEETQKAFEQAVKPDENTIKIAINLH